MYLSLTAHHMPVRSGSFIPVRYKAGPWHNGMRRDSYTRIKVGKRPIVKDTDDNE
jgi:hypothetical protein